MKKVLRKAKAKVEVNKMKEEAKAEKDEDNNRKKANVWMDVDSRLREEKKDIIHDA